MTANGGLPSMVDKSKFTVGENLAVSPGKVVYAEDHLELIQYAPQTDEVWSRPVFIVPPQINKFYIWDLAPGRSIVEHLVAQGHQVFIVSWRNPTEAQADWDLESYVEALDRATAVACEISGSPDLNVVGACSGGITAALLLALWGARGVERAGSLSLFVAILDVSGAQGHLDGPLRQLRDAGARADVLALEGRARGQGPRAGLRLAAAERPDLGLLGQQLPDGRGAAGLRHPLLERRHHQPAGGAAFRPAAADRDRRRHRRRRPDHRRPRAQPRGTSPATPT